MKPLEGDDGWSISPTYSKGPNQEGRASSSSREKRATGRVRRRGERRKKRRRIESTTTRVTLGAIIH